MFPFFHLKTDQRNQIGDQSVPCFPSPPLSSPVSIHSIRSFKEDLKGQLLNLEKTEDRGER
jgi:hypothetical protein